MSFDLAVGSWMGNRDIFDGDATVFAEVLEVMASKRSSKISDDAVCRPNLWMTSSKSSTAFFEVAKASGLYSIHLENLSMVTYTYQKPPSAGLKGPIMSSPQHAKGQEARMVCSSCAGTCICLAKNWHPSYRQTRYSASVMAVG